MNVIVSNKCKDLLNSIDIEIIKKVEGQFDAEEIGNAFKNFYFQRMILDITALKDYKNIENLRKLSTMLDMDKVILLLEDDDSSGDQKFLSKLVSMKIYNFTRNVEGIIYLYNHPNSYRDVAHIQQVEDVKITVNDEYTDLSKTKIIGLKGITKQAGSTSLTYMMKKRLEDKYKIMALEIDKNDFIYLNEKGMESIKKENFDNFISKHSDYEIIIVDLNNSKLEEKCDEVIYMVEPSVIKLNRLMMVDKESLIRLKGKKIILCQSLLEPKDVLDFEYESRVKVFYNLPPLDERDKINRPLMAFLIKMGFDRLVDNEDSERKKILGLF